MSKRNVDDAATGHATQATRLSKRVRISLAVTAAVAAWPVADASAAIFQWDGGGANTTLTTAANWNPNTAPVSNAQNDLQFGAVSLSPPNNFTTVNNTSSDFNVNSITFLGTAGASFSLTGSQYDLQKDNTVQPSITQSSNLAQSIANNLKVSGDQLVLDGTGTGLVTISGLISGGKPIVKNGTSTFLLSGANSSLDAGTTINAGTIIVGHANALDNSTGTITVNNTGTLAVNSAVTFTRTATFASGSTLAGKGTYNPGAFTAGNNVTIAPGINDIGTLSMGNNTTFGAGSKLAISVGSGANNNDRLNVTGILNTSAATSALELTMSGADQGKYTIASATSRNQGSNTNANGGFGSVTGLDPAYRLGTTATQIELIHKATIAMDASGAAQMITGGTIPISGHVANTAPTNSDALTYVLTGSVGVTGLPAGTLNRAAGDANAAAGALFNGSFTSTTLGVNNVGVTASGTDSTTVTNSPQSANFNVNVLDHANGSFDAPANADQNLLSLTFNVNAGQQDTQSYSLSNLLGNRAGLVFVSVAESGDDDDVAGTGFFQNNIGSFGTLAAGGTTGFFDVFFDATSLTNGVYQATYTLNLFDEALAGATAQTLTIEATANVVPEPSFAGLLLVGGLSALGTRRRRKARPVA